MFKTKSNANRESEKPQSSFSCGRLQTKAEIDYQVVFARISII